ncbi:MAG: DUF4328 domain-containing protein, partial [Bacteroidales bacterium]|nr:DUF4328 domain-containing protein [Bacteroidales bacterium]
MKKFNNNGIFGKITALLNVVIFIFFVILMVLVMKFDKINVQYVDETPAFNKATDQLRAAEQPLKMDSIQIAHYQYRLDTLNQKTVPTDKKVAKEFNDEVKRIADLLKEKENLKAVHDSTLLVKKAEITPIEEHYCQTQDEMNSAKSTFAVFAYLVFCLFIIKVALFAFWNYKNSKDIHNYSAWAKKSSSPFWAFVGWIIPVFDLIKPYSFFSELQNDTEYILKDKKLIPDDYDKNDYNDLYIG